ncbi:hypothetical protein CIB48_g1908 [Xylaria polymorpha]|nr:hypothetical protein CIB48_g1908 [Xylaria polymorpha]
MRIASILGTTRSIPASCGITRVWRSSSPVRRELTEKDACLGLPSNPGGLEAYYRTGKCGDPSPQTRQTERLSLETRCLSSSLDRGRQARDKAVRRMRMADLAAWRTFRNKEVSSIEYLIPEMSCRVSQPGKKRDNSAVDTRFCEHTYGFQDSGHPKLKSKLLIYVSSCMIHHPVMLYCYAR